MRLSLVRKDLAGVETRIGAEGRPQPLGGSHVLLAEGPVHVHLLLRPDAVLPGKSSPCVDARPHHLTPRLDLGFKVVKSLGWKWDKTRRTDPAGVSRHWLVLSVATLLALAYGTRVEDAHDRRIAPGNLRTPPKACLVLDTGTPAPRRRDPWGGPVRTVSIIRWRTWPRRKAPRACPRESGGWMAP